MITCWNLNQKFDLVSNQNVDGFVSFVFMRNI